MMSEVAVAVISAKILLPEEQMVILQWIGASAILTAGVVEIIFGYSKKLPENLFDGFKDYFNASRFELI